VAEHVLLLRADGEVVARCRVARSFWSRLRGLLGRRGLPPGTGLLFPRTASVHTHFMRFAIDVVFLDARGEVVALAPELRPWRFARGKGAVTTVELAAGECRRLGVGPGDVLVERPG
jgi:uncharacterized membrane protein (UPF0127 family)